MRVSSLHNRCAILHILRTQSTSKKKENRPLLVVLLSGGAFLLFCPKPKHQIYRYLLICQWTHVPGGVAKCVVNHKYPRQRRWLRGKPSNRITKLKGGGSKPSPNDSCSIATCLAANSKCVEIEKGPKLVPNLSARDSKTFPVWANTLSKRKSNCEIWSHW